MTRTVVADDRQLLVRIMQDAHAGELAAAYAYKGHARSLDRRRPEQAAEVRRIEAAEWHHRAMVGEMLATMGHGPRRGRELLMAAIGRFFGALCFVGGWFGPMYAAGRLEASNVVQYAQALGAAERLNLVDYVPRIVEMVAEEERHERWFGDRVREHWLLRPARFVLGWTPPGTVPGDGSD